MRVFFVYDFDFLIANHILLVYLLIIFIGLLKIIQMTSHILWWDYYAISFEWLMLWGDVSYVFFAYLELVLGEIDLVVVNFSCDKALRSAF